MVNVRKGVVFTTTGSLENSGDLNNKANNLSGVSVAFTTVEGVVIGLADDVSGCVGIQVGGTQIVNSVLCVFNV